jgi:prefoldin subunit 5
MVGRKNVAAESSLARAEAQLAERKAELDEVTATLRAKLRVAAVEIKAEKVPNV